MRLFLLLLLIPQLLNAQPYQQADAAQIKLNLEKLLNPARVLYIAAHPDDENTRLLSWLVSEKKCRTAYLSLTRGDGGQNLIGTEKAELLGVIRTEELLAARRIDGAEQYFTRAVDFGYSKNPEETFEKWGKDAVLSDVVWVIRNFRPDIIITRFPSTGEDGHGHHTASSILAEEAFVAAADPEKFSWQLEYVEPWQAKSVFWNTFLPQRDPKADKTGLITLDVGTYNSLLGRSYGEIASESRSMHKSQGFGAARTRGPIVEYFKQMAGEPLISDIFENVTTEMSRIPGAGPFSKTVSGIIKKYESSAPEKSLKALLKAYAQAEQIKDEKLRSFIKESVEYLIIDCAGLWFEAVSEVFSANPSEAVKVNATLLLRNPAEINLTKISFSTGKDSIFNLYLKPRQLLSLSQEIKISPNASYSIPFWLKEKAEGAMWNILKPGKLAIPKGPAPVEAEFHFSVGGAEFSVRRPVVYKWVDPVEGELYRNLEVIPEVMVNFNKPVYIFRSGEAGEVKITVRAGKNNVSGAAGLRLPESWRSDPPAFEFSLQRKDEEQVFSFKVTPGSDGKNNESQKVSAYVKSDHGSNSEAYIKIDYKHIPLQVLIKEMPAVFTLLDAKVLDLKIAYIPGADDLPEYLAQLGLDVSLIPEDQLEAVDFSQYDVVITGIRAFNINERLKLMNRKLLSFVENGGNLVVQYNTSNFTGTIDYNIGPYPFKITRNRVTDENSGVYFIDPDHRILHVPNKISQEDFKGWVQERGLYFAGDLDRKYKPLLMMNDPGEDMQNGSLILADYGKGSFIYTGLSFFRQLPAGVPGAYRLFINLISYKNEN